VAHQNKMERNFRLYLENKISANKFAAYLSGSKFNSLSVVVEEKFPDFEFIPNLMQKILTDTADKKLSIENLRTIASGLLYSDSLTWDGGTDPGKRISDIVLALDNPDLYVPVTIQNLNLYKILLETGENKLEKK